MLKLPPVPRLLLAATHLTAVSALVLTAAGPAQAVDIDWVAVGDPGNACDPQGLNCFGGVGYSYSISRYEITNAQYAEFLNAVAADDPNALYNTGMGGDVDSGIKRSGSPGSYVYAVKPGFADKPVNYVSWVDALRFANWLHNGQPTGPQNSATTEDGAYTFSSTIEVGPRNLGAVIVLPSEDEWYKAAYYDPLSVSYLDFPMGFDEEPTCSTPTNEPNRANCLSIVDTVTVVGSYTGSSSPYGTFDQGGNVSEWNEALISETARGARGGAWLAEPTNMAAWRRGYTGLLAEADSLGFRVAMIPEPSTALLLGFGLVGLGVVGRRRGRG